MKRSSLHIVLTGIVLTVPAFAQDWPHWRGPNFDGSSEASGLPVDFDRTKVRWSAALPGPGAATPVIVGKSVFVAAVDEEGEQLLALCFDRESGEERWADAAGSGYRAGDKGSATTLDRRSNYASPSPVCDGERVVFFFGNGDLVAYDLDGKRLWARNIQADEGDFAFQWTFATSPTFSDGMLFLPILQRDQPVNGIGRDKSASFLLAIDPKNGKNVYRRERTSEARVESRESYATAIPHARSDGRREILVLGGDVISGHDPASGVELWRWGQWNPSHREPAWRIVPSPVAGGEHVLVCAPKGAPIYALDLGEGEDLENPGVAWKSEGRNNPLSSDVPTPLYYRGSFYVLGDRERSLSRVSPGDGKAQWTTELPGRAAWEASPTGADGKVWCMNHEGLVAVVDAESGKLLASIPMGEDGEQEIRSSIAVAHGSLFIRTNTTLFCAGGG